MCRIRFISIISVLFFFSTTCFTQTNVRSWHADGQNWIVWEYTIEMPDYIFIYKNENFNESIDEWEHIGSLFPEMTVPASMKMHIHEEATFRIPDGSGGIYELQENEGLFVDTPNDSGDFIYAVSFCNEEDCPDLLYETQTTDKLKVDFNDIDRVIPHLQAQESFGDQQFIQVYYMWSMGKTDHNEGRPDFPVMGNSHTNGWPHLFAIWTGPNAELSNPVPAAYWFHGGSGNFSQYFPDKRKEININVNEGILIAHNDDFMRYVNGQLVFNESNSWWFGWSQNHNPLNKSYSGPSEQDTIINYTQRRIKWVHDWLVEEEIVDPTRVQINGYSVGSAGAVALVKSYPSLFSVANIFNCGHRGPDEDNFGSLLLGTEDQNLPTNIKDRFGQNLGVHEMYDLTNLTDYEDWPLMKAWHGKKDINPTMKWDELFLKKVKHADSIGWGYQLFWDERAHPISGIMTHWTQGENLEAQTIKDNTAFHEHFRNDKSYPVFFNYYKYGIPNSDPGSGSGSIGQGDGDDWGTWGGYHEYDLLSIVDNADYWSVEYYLSGVNANEIDRYHGEEDCILSDFAVRRLQNFDLGPLEEFEWRIIDQDGNIIKDGVASANHEGIPIIEGIIACRDPKRAKLELKRKAIEVCEEEGELGPEAGVYCKQILVDGVERSFLTIVPESYDQSAQHPVVFAFHGGGGNMTNFAFGEVTGEGSGREEFHQLAAEEKMILVYPQALVHPEMNKTSWNVFEFQDQSEDYADDLEFFDQILDQLQDDLSIDNDRIYALGYSRGGDFAQLLGRRRSCDLAAVGSVGSSSGGAFNFMENEITYFPPGEKPVSILMIKGDKDFKRPWNGGLNNSQNYTIPGNEDLNQWLINNGCESSSTIESETDSLYIYNNNQCNNSTEVSMHRGFYLQHVWPDQDEMMGINANQIFIEFLKSKKRGGDCSSSNVDILSKNFIMFPNPSNNRVFLQVEDETSIEVYLHNASGCLVKETILNGDQWLDVSDLNEGLYIISFRYRNNWYRHKLMKLSSF